MSNDAGEKTLTKIQKLEIAEILVTFVPYRLGQASFYVVET